MRRPSFISGLKTIWDNPVLFKETSQWLRTGNFPLVFLGFLLICEITCVAVLVTHGSHDPGKISFSILVGILLLYAVFIGFSGSEATAREVKSGTMEFYELSGITPGKMVKGKILSMLHQYLLAFFSAAPFLLFSYYLGGVDFLQIFDLSLMLLFFGITIFFLGQIRGLFELFRPIRFVAMFLMILFIPETFFMVVYALLKPVPILRNILELDPGFTTGIFVFLVLQLMLYILYFLICCQAFCRRWESRLGSIFVLFVIYVIARMIGIHAMGDLYGMDMYLGLRAVMPAWPLIIALFIFVMFTDVT